MIKDLLSETDYVETKSIYMNALKDMHSKDFYKDFDNDKVAIGSIKQA
jgi:hypothetical protein